jgi:ATP-citrate lyase beta-subunit
MARKKIREFDAKRLIVNCIAKNELNRDFSLAHKAAIVTAETNLDSLGEENPWLQECSLVVKPDQLFGKRKKLELVLLNAQLQEVIDWIRQKRNQEITIGRASGELTHFLIEPFTEHEQEYFVAFKSLRDKDQLLFSEQGGIDIEDNWDNVVKIDIPTLSSIEEVGVEDKLFGIDAKVVAFIKVLYQVFTKLDFAYLEVNPFTLNVRGEIVLLDTVAQIDDCASFKNNWNNLTFPKEFGKRSFAAEEHIEKIDQISGASLKLTVLNKEGKIWNILGGGGASIIYLDMIANLGKGDEIANYGESSGNPSTTESYEYAKAIIEMMMQNNGRVLFIVGGIANFTDVRKTFLGFIKALEEFAQQLKELNVAIYVRRGGPHYEAGLRLIEEKGKELGIPIFVHGPETSMPKIISMAREAL